MTAGFRKYLAVGSSSTAGAGASKSERSYVELIAARVRGSSPDLAVKRLASGGATVGRFLSQRLTVESFGPDLVTILPFSDFVTTPARKFRAGYIELLDRFEAVGAATFFGDLRIDPTHVRAYGPEQFAMLSEKNAIVAELAMERTSVTVVPIIDPNMTHPEWSGPDGHPNDQGHSYLGSAFIRAIEPYL